MKKRRFRPAALLLALLMALVLAGCSGEAPSHTESDTGPAGAGYGQRDYRTRFQGGGDDVVTLMIYLCGSDLESEGGAASADLREIMDADIADNLNIIVETGGAANWENDFVEAETNQRWQLTSGGPQLLKDVGARNMSKGETLSSFIANSAEAFPADRYMLVLWDHGGGTVDGYAWDERYDGDGMMPLPELNTALADAGVVFDMVGFDCCLMGTAETAFMVEKYADFMVASQRVEPGDGWYYTPWIDALSADTSLPTEELGRVIVDSFIEESRSGYYGDELTLSVTDLSYVTSLFETMYAFFAEAESGLVEDSGFISTSQALGQSRAVADNYDLVDLVYLTENMTGSEALLEKIGQAVVYNGATIDDHNGMCLYFPYTDLSKVETALGIYSQIGIDETYQRFITTFASLMVGGQTAGGGGDENPLGGEGFDILEWLDLDWVDELLIEECEEFYSENSYDGSELVIEEKGDDFVLRLSDEDWQLITAIKQRVFLDDGEGYIDLGADSMYEFDGDGDLLISFDNTWVALDGQLVCFYTLMEVTEGDSWYTYGAVPILMEGEAAELIVAWDNETPEGYVAGWRTLAHGTGSQKGLFELADGMRFDFLFDYYTYDGGYDEQYLWGEHTVNGSITVSYEDVGDADRLVYYELLDIYQNSYWTEAVMYSLE